MLGFFNGVNTEKTVEGLFVALIGVAKGFRGLKLGT
jgi:hypothetical protein